MKFEIDMSGCDILRDNSVIGISGGNGLIRGFKINTKLINGLLNNWKNKEYFCRFSIRNQGFFKAMIYSSVICCLLENLNAPLELELEICRDLRFHENNIKQRLNKLLKEKLEVNK